MRIDTKAAVSVEVSYGGDDVCVRWPSIDDEQKWDVWDSRYVRQGARLIASFKNFRDAEKAALKLLGKKDG